MKTWIVNGRVHDVVNSAVLDLDILIENGKIAALGKCDNDGSIIDAAGKDVYPGLVEAHCHLGLEGFGFRYDEADYNELNDAVTPELNPIDAFNPFCPSVNIACKAGVTCVGTGPGSSNVLGGNFIAVKTHGKCVDDMIVREKAAMKCAFGENPKNCYRGKSINSRMSTAAKLRNALFKAREYMRKLEAAGDDVAKRPDYNMQHEALLPVLRGEMPLKAHAHQANDILTAIRIAREFNVKLTLEHCTEGHLIVEKIVESGCPVAVGPTLSHVSKPELRNKSFVTPGVLAKAGCQVSIITDSGVIPQEHLALCAQMAVKAGMEPAAALQAITINPARHLGIADRVGSIEVGKDADIIICSGDILNNMTQVEKVLINGEVVA